MKNLVLDIINSAIKNASPYDRVRKHISECSFPDELTVISVGKAACSMAQAAYDTLNTKIKQGFILTKYGYGTPMPDVFRVFETGHPIPDKNSVKYTDIILEEAKKLTSQDRILFLLSGGASALFEKPKIPLDELKNVTDILLKSGADIKEMNSVRKALSYVKGGAFANSMNCKIDCIILSDVIGNDISAIGSGPCCTNDTETDAALEVLNRYYRKPNMKELAEIIKKTDFHEVTNTTNTIIGSVEELRDGAVAAAEKYGYRVQCSPVDGEANERGKEIANKAISIAEATDAKTALIYYGETTVTVKGHGKGGRNQEMVLSAAIELRNRKQNNILIASVGSDGTDGPTDAAGAIADCKSFGKMVNKGLDPFCELNNNNSYVAMRAIDSLIITGATGTNVNDITIVLIN